MRLGDEFLESAVDLQTVGSDPNFFTSLHQTGFPLSKKAAMKVLDQLEASKTRVYRNLLQAGYQIGTALGADPSALRRYQSLSARMAPQMY